MIENNTKGKKKSFYLSKACTQLAVLYPIVAYINIFYHNKLSFIKT